MKHRFIALPLLLILAMLSSCAAAPHGISVAATTLPVYEFASRICQGTDIQVTRLITENVSCLHDYTLQVNQMRQIESSQAVIISGAGLEDFLTEAFTDARIIDSSVGIELACPSEIHDHHHDEGHHHDHDPHIWLSPVNAKIMAKNICDALSQLFPEYQHQFQANYQSLENELTQLNDFATEALAELSCRKLITFHDGFSYLAQEYGLTILEAVEEESGSEASAAELIHLIRQVQKHQLPAIFTEINGADSAAKVIAAETGVPVYQLDMAMAGDSYFEAMYHNINTLKEALQ